MGQCHRNKNLRSFAARGPQLEAATSKVEAQGELPGPIAAIALWQHGR
jgi:hypothetical protein